MGRDSIVSLLLSKEIRDTANNRKDNVIAAAALKGFKVTVRILVNVVCSPSEMGKMYHMALETACSMGNLEVCKTLLDWIKPTKFTLSENTALKITFLHGRLDLISM